MRYTARMPVWTVFEPVRGLRLLALAREAGLCRLSILKDDPRTDQAWVDGFIAGSGEGWRRDPNDPILVEAARQLTAYFSGSLREFTLPLDLAGTDFQQRVWKVLRSIPYGQTRSYGWLAAATGNPRAVRAVGSANARNPAPIVVPCHRVIAAGGGLQGYAGGLEIKRLLLDLEAHSAAASAG